MYKSIRVDFINYINRLFEKTNTTDWIWVPNIILVFVFSVIIKIDFFFESLLFWIGLLLAFPILSGIKNNSKISHLLRAFMFILITTYAVTLFIGVDNSRDNIGYSFIHKYDVSYIAVIEYSEEGEELEIDVPHINTGNDSFNFILEFIYPIMYRFTIIILLVLSLKFDVVIQKEHRGSK